MCSNVIKKHEFPLPSFLLAKERGIHPPKGGWSTFSPLRAKKVIIAIGKIIFLNNDLVPYITLYLSNVQYLKPIAMEGDKTTITY